MLWWLSSVSSGAAVLLLMRWMFHIARPRDDWRRLAGWTARAVGSVREAGRTLLRAYGPVTEDMRRAWNGLRQRYQSGAFGEQGT